MTSTDEHARETALLLDIGQTLWAGGLPAGISVPHDLDWGYFLDQAYRHRMMGLCRLTLFGDGGENERLRHRGLYDLWYRVTARNNAAILRETGRILAALRAAGVDVVVRKGPALLELVYQDPGTRQMSDLDLLLRPGSERKFQSVLDDLGYLPGTVSRDRKEVIPNDRQVEIAWRLHTYNLPPMHRLTGDPVQPSIMVDPARAIFLPNSGFTLPAGHLLDSAVTIDSETAGALPVLAPHHMVIDLCGHLHKESTSLRYLRRGKHQRLTQYLDVLGYLRRVSLDWDELLACCARYRLARPVYFAFVNAQRLYPEAPIPAEVVAELGRQDGLTVEYADTYAQLDLQVPLRWDQDLRTRLFTSGIEPFPATRSLV
ncbi:nucleotidyltransferase family protein [Nonomuraea sp. NPDC050786]|uniref:nucleotidyltransferase family protein n=1 Tax=Nonomuraea sp. NPDC050786 TaxID=3154840 RepID=UPI003409C818